MYTLRLKTRAYYYFILKNKRDMSCASVFFNGCKISINPSNLSLRQIDFCTAMYNFENGEQFTLPYDENEELFLKRFSKDEKIFTRKQSFVTVTFNNEARKVRNSIHVHKPNKRQEAISFLQSLQFDGENDLAGNLTEITGLLKNK
jgi:hypothetical protein